MQLDKYQQCVQRGLFVEVGNPPLVNAVLGLAGEAGEVADLVKKSQYIGRQLDTKKMLDELGDVLWYLTYCAGHLGYTIADLAYFNIAKLHERHPHLYPNAETLCEPS